MRGQFSIEWLSQSSKPTQGTHTASACGTHSESLPGFYCRPKSDENSPKVDEVRSQKELDAFTMQHQSSHSNNQGNDADFSSSSTEEETSGYESEGCHSALSPLAQTDCSNNNTSSISSSSSSSITAPASPLIGRRPRTAFTAEQINSMERAFKRNAYLGTQDKAELCKKLSLSDKQIRNWFQNRRMKLKRTVQDALAHACQANVASQLMHYPELQAYRAGPYPRYHSTTQENIHPHSLQYASAMPSHQSLPLDTFYQYSGLPGVIMPSAMGPSYPTYQQYY